MKFEYKLDYNFVNKNLTFEITTMLEKLRGEGDITRIESNVGNTWTITSMSHPEIGSTNTIYLRGNSLHEDCLPKTKRMDWSRAVEVADVLEKLQAWIEKQGEEVVMTIAEIEAKLGIKNLKIKK